jgi:hypothetical protein
VPSELVAAGDRRASMRRRTARSLERANTRRRLTSTAIVGVLTLFGVGVADAGIQHTLAPATTTSPPTTSPTLGRTYARLHAIGLSLAADRQALARLQRATAAAINAGLPAASSSGPAAATAPSAAPSSPAPLPPPPTHVTTGASRAG